MIIIDLFFPTNPEKFKDDPFYQKASGKLLGIFTSKEEHEKWYADNPDVAEYFKNKGYDIQPVEFPENTGLTMEDVNGFRFG